MSSDNYVLISRKNLKMPNDSMKPGHTPVFRHAGLFVSTVLRAARGLQLSFFLCLALVPSLGLQGRVVAENIVYPGPGASTQEIVIPRTIRTTDLPVDAVAPESDEMEPRKFKSKSLSGNTITIFDGQPVQFVLGAINTVDGDEIRNNIITIHPGVVISDTAGIPSDFAGVYGGYSLKGNVTGNRIFVTDATIRNSSDEYGSVVGAYGLNAVGNSVTVSGSDVCMEVRGGHATTSEDAGTESKSSTASENRVSISNSQVGEYVYGGYTQIQNAECSGEAIASTNAVYLSNVSVLGVGGDGGDIYGGKVRNAGTGASEAVGNLVIIDNNSHVGVHVMGGALDCMNSNIHRVSDNMVIVNGSTVDGSVYGGWFHSSTASGTARGNTVSVIDSEVGVGVFGASLDGGARAEALENSVTISGSSITSTIYGGIAHASTAVASNNKVTIGNSVVTAVNGGTATGEAGDAVASGNSVIFNDGGMVLGTAVMGGSALSTGGAATASHNTVTLNGGTFVANIFGGFANGSDTSSATYNTVNLMAGEVNGIIYGGFCETGSNPDDFTGNTLNVIGYQNSVIHITNFENYKFIMPSVLTPDLKMIDITGSQDVNLADSHVTLQGKMKGGYVGLQPGETIILIDKTDGTPASMTALPVRQGVALIHTFGLSADDNQLVAIYRGKRPGLEIADGRLPLLAFLNHGAYLDELRTARCTRGPFVSIGGSWNHYNTGGHIDVDGLTLKTGVTRCFNFAHGKLLLAPFFETGKGESDTFNIYEGKAIRANGKLKYFGGGLMSKYYLRNGRYYDASFRVGGAEIDYYSEDLSRLTGVNAAFDITSLYVGSHVGLGQEWHVSRNISFDVYGRYFYQHLAGGTVIIADDPIHYCSLNSQRTRFGGRVNHGITQRIGFYHGAAWEHEFSATERANYYEYHVIGQSLGGDSGIGEVGLTLKRTPTMPLNIDFGIQGYVGKREGGAANLQVRWER